MRTQFERKFDLSGGVQGATSWLLRANNEVEEIINGRLDDEIGAITRRNGHTKQGDDFQDGKSGLGFHTAKFSTGQKMFIACNNAADTATVIKHYNEGTGAWTELSLPVVLPPNTEIQFYNSLNEMYIAGMDDTGERIALINVQEDLTVSATRNLIGAPKARFITEFGGSLYAINTKVDSTVYADRAYKSSPALSVITYSRGSQRTLSDNKLSVDSARYLKAGMEIDIYDHITGTALYSGLVIDSVDKADDSIVLPTLAGSLTFTAATTDVLTVSSTTNFSTGTPVRVSSTTTLPAPLVADTIYYAIKLTATTLKLATTQTNATAGTAIDITSTGSGTHTLHTVYNVPDNEEIYLAGRKGELYYLWNTDYPSEDKSDYLRLPSGIASNSDIVGWSRTNNRLLFFTSSTMVKWDGGQLITRYEDIGCANFETIVNIGDWLLWLDSEGRVNAYNDSTGQHEFISKAIRKRYLKEVPSANFAHAAAGKIDNIYKLSLGLVNGTYLRVCYDFDSNNWTIENHKRPMIQHTINDISGFMRLYFLDNDGNMFLDDEGDLDYQDTIPMRIKFGRNMSGTDKMKTYSGWYIFGQNVTGATVKCYMEGSNKPIPLGSLTDNISRIQVGNKPVHGRDVNLEITVNTKGEPAVIEGYAQYFSSEEDNFG